MATSVNRIALLIYINVILAVICWPHRVNGEIRIQPSLLLEERYDTNFFSKSETQTSDDTFITTLAPAINITYLQKDFSISASYSHNFRYLHQTSDLRDDGASQAALGMVFNPSEKTSISLSDSLSFAEEEPATTATEGADAVTQDSTTMQETGIQISRTEKITNNFSLGLSQEISPQTSVNITIADSLLIFLDSPLIDSRTDSIDIAGSHELTTKTSLNINYGYSNFYFDDPAGEVNQDTHTLQAGFTQLLSPIITYNASAGVSYSSEPDNTLSVIGSSSLRITLQTSSISLSYNRGVTSSSGLTSERSLTQSVSLGWAVPLSNTLNIGISVTASESNSLSTNNVDTISYNAGIAGGWQVFKWMDIGFGYNHSQQTSSGTLGNDIRRDVVFINAVVLPSEWRL